MKKYVLFFLFLSYGISAFSQEQVLPYYKPSITRSEPKINLLHKKNGISYPIVDHFVVNGKVDSLLWVKSQTEIVNRKVIFNALDRVGLSY
ncbi:MAG: hypothetical protein ACOVK9_01265, partial [Bacteroidia bacterium]